MLLAGDIGATKTILSLISEEVGPAQPVAEQSYKSQDYPDLLTIIQEFLGAKTAPRKAVFGVPGPVLAGRAVITHLPWEISEGELEKHTGVGIVRLINDLQATVTAVPYLADGDLFTIKEGVAEEHASLAVVAPGTGLGEAYAVWNGAAYVARASEGGHTDFGPRNDLEYEFLGYLVNVLGLRHVSYEQVCSGLGIPNIYRFFKSRCPEKVSTLDASIQQASDPVPLIVNAALGEECQLCKLTLEMFLDILASEAANLSLKVLATGGVYLGGGIPPRIVDAIDKQRFVDRFCNKGKMSNLTERIPVKVILNAKAALIGAAWYGIHHLHS